MNIQMHIKSQHAKTGKSGEHGPDAYVAVTVCPDNVKMPKILRRDILEKRGISFYYFGEGYSRYSGPRSMLGRAIIEAEEWIKDYKGQEKKEKEKREVECILAGTSDRYKLMEI